VTKAEKEQAPVEHGLEEKLVALEAERDEYLNDLKRVAAEFENYRKRAARDQESLVARAHERLVKELLPVLDNLERALEAARDPETRSVEEGVRLVHRELAAGGGARARGGAGRRSRRRSPTRGSRRSRRTGTSTRTSTRRCSRSRRPQRRAR
jgi:hypothetical protein